MTTVRTGWSRAVVCTAALAAGVLVGGCVSAEPRDRPPPKQPQWARASTVWVSSSFPEDTDGNGYLDLIGVTVYIFDDQFPGASIRVPGAFSFTLSTADGAPLAVWNMSEEQTAGSIRGMPPGPGYVLSLSLLDKGTDRTDIRNAELHTVFTPTGGTPVRAKTLAVMIGRSGLRPSP